MVKADRPDLSNHFNYRNDHGMNTSYYTSKGRKLLMLPAIADTYTFLMNTWNTLLESYQLTVNKNTLATAKRHIQ